jgi:hypothetical protein
VNCLLARRLIQGGVRFVMLAPGSWDDHADLLKKNLKKNCDITNQLIASLLKDLKQRNLLDTTLVIWGGEFGRKPDGRTSQTGRRGDNAGREHRSMAYSTRMAS